MSEIPDDPDFSSYLDSGNSNFEFIARWLQIYHDQMVQNMQLMPGTKSFWEVTELLEPRILKLYQQTHMITLMGLDRASIILQGVLLEQMVRELYYVEKDEEADDNLHNLLRILRDEMSEEAFEYIDYYREEIRNNWVHDDNEDIAEGLSVPGTVINFDPENPDDLIQKVKEAKEKPLGELDMDDNRVVGDMIMNQRDRAAIALYPKTHEVVEELAETIHEKYGS